MNKLVLFTFLLGAIQIAPGQTQSTKRIYKATRISEAPVINGDLTDDAWTHGFWGGDFTQQKPYDGAKPSQPSEFLVCFDDMNLYIAIKAYDFSPDIIATRMMKVY